MACEICGCDRFFAHQVCHHDILVDGDKNFIEDKGIYYASAPFEPFTCEQCGAEFDSISESAYNG